MIKIEKTYISISANSKYAHFFIVMAAIIINFARLVSWTLLTADPTVHNDSVLYFKGYEVILQEGFQQFGVNEYFGKSTEVLLPLIYFISSFIFTVQNENQLILFHTIIFSIIYTLALLKIFYVKKGFLLYKARYGYASKYWIVIFMSVCPPGVAMQTSRQAIAFAVTIYILSNMYDRWKSYYPFLGIILTTLMHVGSVLNTMLVMLIYKNKIHILYLFLLLVVAYIIVSIDIVNSLLNLNYAEFRYQESSSFTYSMLINALIFLFLFNTPRRFDEFLSLIPIVMIIITLLFDYQFFLRRVFFGFDFFIIPFILLSMSYNPSIFYLRNSRNRLLSLALTTLILSNSALMFQLFVYGK